MIKIMAKELKGSGVTANCVAPGPTATEFFFAEDGGDGEADGGCLPDGENWGNDVGKSNTNRALSECAIRIALSTLAGNIDSAFGKGAICVTQSSSSTETLRFCRV
ncbi:hypothetical protein Syun_012223 [Stephania yunnanensis]|uniref:Uncharacterized protein n=1 Tax=Stephania yunnanensis TaxID=152371 RepID=A0AAP0PF41_9MAGN